MKEPEAFKEKKMSSMASLYFMTGGWYGLYWLVSTALRLSKAKWPWAGRFASGLMWLPVVVSATLFLYAALPAVLDGLVDSRYLTVEYGFAKVVFYVYLHLYTCLFGMAWAIASALKEEEKVLGMEGTSRRRAIFLTLLAMWSALYLQRRINAVAHNNSLQARRP